MDASREQVLKAFEHCGHIQHVKMRKQTNAYIQFGTEDAVQSALNVNGVMLVTEKHPQGRPLRVRISPDAPRSCDATPR